MNIKSMNIPETVTHIDPFAFSNTSLEYIHIPDSVEYMEDGVFEYDSQLRKVTFGNNVRIKKFGDMLFKGCDMLENIEIPDSVTVIGAEAFGQCKNLKNVKLPKNLKYINQEAFLSCESIRSIVIPENVKRIGDSAFYGTSLEHIHLSEGIEHIGIWAFRNSKLRSVTFSDNIRLEDTGPGVFEGCSRLEYIDLPTSIKIIGESAFSHCESLREVKLPDNLNHIKVKAFEGCDSLQSIEIPQTIKSIGMGAFAGCRSLDRIKLPIRGKEVTIDRYTRSIIFRDGVGKVANIERLKQALGKIFPIDKLGIVDFSDN